MKKVILVTAVILVTVLNLNAQNSGSSNSKMIPCDEQTADVIRKYSAAIKLMNESGILDFPEESVKMMKKVDEYFTVQNGLCNVQGFFDGIQILDYLQTMFDNFVNQCAPSSPLYQKGRDTLKAINEAMDDMTALFYAKDLLKYL